MPSGRKLKIGIPVIVLFVISFNASYGDRPLVTALVSKTVIGKEE